MPIAPIDVLQSVINGVLQGGFFALASVGLSLIYGVQKILNLAHGAFIVLASFITIQFSILLTPRLGLDPLASIGVDFAILAVLGVATYYTLIYRIERKGFEGPLLATFGFSVFLEYVIANGLSIPVPTAGGKIAELTVVPVLDPSYGNGATVQNQAYSSGVINLGQVYLLEPQLIGFIIALAVVPLLALFLSRTYYGNGIRATAQDWEAAEFSGVNTGRTRLLSFTIGCGLAGIAGGVFAFTNSITPSVADISLLPIILAIIVLGGVGSVFGTLLGGISVGLIISTSQFLAFQVLTQYKFPSDFGQLLTFAIFLIVMMVKPTGFFGRLG